MELIGGALVYLLFCIAIISMIVEQVNMIIDDVKKEERKKARNLARLLAEREYHTMIQNTNFKVKQAVVISNESDIEW